MNEGISSIREALFESSWERLTDCLEAVVKAHSISQDAVDKSVKFVLFDVCATISSVLSLVDSVHIRKRLFLVTTALFALGFESPKDENASSRIVKTSWLKYVNTLGDRWDSTQLIQTGCVDDWDALRFLFRCGVYEPETCALIIQAVHETLRVPFPQLMHAIHFETISKDLVAILSSKNDGVNILAQLFQSRLFFPSHSLESIQKTLFISQLFSKHAGNRISSRLDPISDSHILLIACLSNHSTLPSPSSALINALICQNPTADLAIACLIECESTVEHFPLIDKKLVQFFNMVGEKLISSDLVIRLSSATDRFPKYFISILNGMHRKNHPLSSRTAMVLLLHLIDPVPPSIDRDLLESVSWLIGNLDTESTSSAIVAAKSKENFPVLLLLSPLPLSDEVLKSCPIHLVVEIPLVNSTVRNNCARVLSDKAKTASLDFDSVSPVSLLTRTVEVAESFNSIHMMVDMIGDRLTPKETLETILKADTNGGWWNQLLRNSEIISNVIQSESIESSIDLNLKIPQINRLLSFPQRLDLLSFLSKKNGNQFHSRL